MPLAITYTVPTRTRSDSQNISDVISQQSYNGYFLNFTSTSCYQLNGLFVFLCIKAVMTTMIYPKRCSTKIRLQMCSIVWFYVYQHLDINKFIVPVFLLFWTRFVFCNMRELFTLVFWPPETKRKQWASVGE